MSHTPEIILKRVVAQSLATLRNPDSTSLIRHMFKDLVFVDPKIVDRFIHYMQTKTQFPVELNYPKADMVIPSCYVVTRSKKEDPNYQVMGDMRGFGYIYAPDEHYLTGITDDETGHKIIAATINTGWADSAQYQIIVMSEDDELCPMITAALTWLLFFAKLRLEHDFNMSNMTHEVMDFHLDLEFIPPRTYTRMIVLRFLEEKIIDGQAMKGTVDEQEYWHTIYPILNRFLLALVDGEEVAILDPDGTLDIINETEDP